MDPDQTINNLPKGKVADKFMQNAMKFLEEEYRLKPSRQLANAIDHLEVAAMLNNKDRTIKGELKPYPTHNAVENLTEMPK